jgi:hypothetical protein
VPHSRRSCATSYITRRAKNGRSPGSSAATAPAPADADLCAEKASARAAAALDGSANPSSDARSPEAPAVEPTPVWPPLLPLLPPPLLLLMLLPPSEAIGSRDSGSAMSRWPS